MCGGTPSVSSASVCSPQVSAIKRFQKELADVARLTHAVVAQAAVGGARRPEHLAGEAVLEFHHLLVDDDLLGARRRPVAGAAVAVCTRGRRRGENGAGGRKENNHNGVFVFNTRWR